MNEFNSPVEQHYSRTSLFENILARLEALGIDRKHVTRKDIAGVDEFHVRGAAVSLELAREAGFNEHSKVLDVGCGIGGPGRMLAEEFGCKVTGIDITGEYIKTARALSELVGLQAQTEFIQGDANQLPFRDETFDFAWTQHVQMNIIDKERFYSEISRVLTEDGLFIYYDIFATGNGHVYFPVPWAEDESLSHLITTDELKNLLPELGFDEVKTKDQTEESIKFFTGLFDKIAKEGAPKIGLQLLMGDSTLEKLKNILRSVQDNRIVLQSGMYRKK